MNRTEIIEFLQFVEKGIINPAQIKTLPALALQAVTPELTDLVADASPYVSFLVTQYRDEYTDKIMTAQQVYDNIQMRRVYPFGFVLVSEKTADGGKLYAGHIIMMKIDKDVQAKYLLFAAQDGSLQTTE